MGGPKWIDFTSKNSWVSTKITADLNADRVGYDSDWKSYIKWSASGTS